MQLVPKTEYINIYTLKGNSIFVVQLQISCAKKFVINCIQSVYFIDSLVTLAYKAVLLYMLLQTGNCNISSSVFRND